jgi:hypothetical protein
MAYFFHLNEGGETVLDHEGTDLPDLASVEALAMKIIGALVAEAVTKGQRDYEGQIVVEDEHGQSVLTLTASCPVQISTAATLQVVAT